MHIRKVYEDDNIEDYFSWEVGDHVWCVMEEFHPSGAGPKQILKKGKEYVITRIDKMCEEAADIIIGVDASFGYSKGRGRNGKAYIKDFPVDHRTDPAAEYSWSVLKFTKNRYHPILKDIRIKSFDL